MRKVCFLMGKVLFLSILLTLMWGIGMFSMADTPVVLDASQPEAYMNDTSLTEVVISKDSFGIGDYAFSGCVNLRSVTLPYGVWSIGEHAFDGCDNLMIYGISETAIGTNWLYDWRTYGHEKYAKEQGIPFIGRQETSQEGYVYVIDEGECTILSYQGDEESIEIPSNIEGYPVTQIGQYAFYLNESINFLSVPSNVKRIDDGSFQNCNNLEIIDFSEGLESLGVQAFYHCKKLKGVELPESLQIMENNSFGNCEELESISISEGNENFASIGGLLYDKAMTKVIFCPSGRQGLVSIPYGIEVIGPDAFTNCLKLEGITIPESVKSIQNSGMHNCNELTAINLPTSLEEIIGNPFEACQNLARFAISEDNTYFATVDGVLYDKGITRLICVPTKKDGNFTVPDNIEIIDDRAFDGCGFTSVILPSSLKVIPRGLFMHCRSLTSIEIPPSVEEIVDEAFRGCSALEEVRLPEGLKEINPLTFVDCKKLTSVNIPASVTKILNHAFHGCLALEDLYVPASVVEIVPDAFEECENLTLYGESGSYVERFAAEQGIPFIVEADGATAAKYPTLRKGDKGDAVKRLQQRLIDLGFLSGGADGDYGNITARAVEEFQKSEGMTETGIADSVTQAALFE